ncbi:MAG: S1 RNA-binding domain-containing protein [Bacilli bacterium]|nr:S1 RNA-binding domain-containing protein [Bacilli bacterium]
MDDIKVNDIIKVTVTGIQKYGAFVLINDKYDGLIHISEISSGYVKNINDYIKIKDKIYAQVVDVDVENNKFKLSIKNIDYRNDGKIISSEDNFSNGFEPLKEHLDLWINEKIKEIMDKM